jgi:hypothetical protein
MFFAPVVRTRAYAPALRSYDRSFERFINDAFFTHTRLACRSPRTTRPGPSRWMFPASPRKT